MDGMGRVTRSCWEKGKVQGWGEINPIGGKEYGMGGNETIERMGVRRLRNVGEGKGYGRYQGRYGRKIREAGGEEDT